MLESQIKKKQLSKILSLHFIAIIIVPISVADLFLYYFFSESIRKEAVYRNMLLAESIAGEIERFMIEPLKILQHISHNVEKGNLKQGAVNSYLGTVISDYNYFESIEIINSAGKIEYIAPYNRDFIGNSVMTEEYRKFINLTGEGKQVYISPTFISFQTGKTTIAISSVFGSNVLIGFMNLNSIQKVVDRLTLKKGFAFITDKNGIVIAHPDMRIVNERVSFNHLEPVREGIKGLNGTYYYNDRLTDYAASVSNVPGTGMVVAVVQPVQEIFYTLKTVKMFSLIVIIAITIASFFIGKVIIQRLIKPIQSLVYSTQNVANGDYNFNVEESRYTEISEISHNFIKMIDAVKNRESDLKKTRNYLQALFNAQSSILVSVNREGTIDQHNKAALEFAFKMGLSIEKDSIWKIFPFLAEHKEQIIETISGKSEILSFETAVPEYYTRYYRVFCYSAAYENEKRALIRIDDISELKIREEQLVQIQKMDTIGTLVGGLAHDFNNVLGGIVGTVSILEYKIKQKKPVEPEKLNYHVSIMKEAGGRASKIIQQLLTLSRKHDSVLEPADLNLIIRRVMDICETTIDKSVALDPQYSDIPAIVKADRQQMEQVILNLCVNAAHAMTIMKEDEKWGGQLSITLEKISQDSFITINGSGDSVSGYWRLSVADTGVGMKKEVVERIFDPFFTTKEIGKGTGLGLAMVYNIIRNHNGFVKVYSEEGAGSIFHVYLPVSGDESAFSDTAASELFIKHGEGLVLVIDDEQVLRNIVKDMLEECGYSVVTCQSGTEGVEYFSIHKNTIKAVFLDMSMPVMSGREVYYKLLEIDPDVKVLLASGFKHDARVEELLSAGIKSFIQKPPTLQKLSEEIYKTIYE